LAQFVYEAQDKNGRLVKGTIEAPNDIKAREILKEKEFLVLSLNFKPSFLEPFFALFKRVSLREKAIFSRQLSTMVSAGIDLSQSLRIMLEQTQNKNLKQAIVEIIADVEEGFSFSMAMARHQYIFSSFYINMLRSGESSGNLDRVLLVLADQQEKDMALTSKVKGALTYPIFILVALVVVGTLMMIYVLPNLKNIFESSGAQLPATTRLLFGLADFLKKFWWLLFLALFGGITGLKMWFSTKKGKVVWNTIQLKIPIFKSMFKDLYVARFTNTAYMLLFSGVPILETLQITADVIDNVHYEKLLRSAAAQVEKGVPLSLSLRQGTLFPPMVSHMIAVGEQTGKIDYILQILSKFFTEEAETKVKNISTLIEPIVILIMGGAVAFLLFSVMIPLYNVTQQAGGG